jgi:hypothetical protein
MTGWRVYPASLLAAVVVAGCGSGDESVRVASPAKPRALELGWVEQASASGLVFRAHRFVVNQRGWQLTASVANHAEADYTIDRPHRPGESMFGLVLLETATRKELRELTADYRKAPPFLEPDRIEPPLPRVLSAGTSWRGTMSGSTVLREGAVVRFLFGRFVRTRGAPGYLLWVTQHAVRLQAHRA